DDRAAGQDQVIIGKRAAFAARADIPEPIALQVDVGYLRRQPRRPSHHLAAGDNNVQRGDRAPDHLGKHWREDEMILAADKHDLDLGRKFPLQVLRERHAAKPAADDNYPSFTHTLIFSLAGSDCCGAASGPTFFRRTGGFPKTFTDIEEEHQHQSPVAGAVAPSATCSAVTCSAVPGASHLISLRSRTKIE